jgi:hypothetical protein
MNIKYGLDMTFGALIASASLSGAPVDGEVRSIVFLDFKPSSAANIENGRT